MTDSSILDADLEEIQSEATEQRETNTSAISDPYKILGDIDDANDGVGVFGRNTASTGVTKGVVGETQSSTTGAAGVRGDTSNDNIGVEGRAYDTASNLGTLGNSESVGVIGKSDRTNGSGVLGWAKNHYGVGGRSDDSAAAGVVGFNPNGGPAVQANGNLVVTGTIERDVGARVYMSSSQSISNRTETKIQFDSVDIDDRNEWDTSNYKFVCSTSGAYHVDVGVRWQDQIPGSSSGDNKVELDVNVNGTTQAYAQDYIAVDSYPTHQVSRTLRKLSANDEITVTIRHNLYSSYSLDSDFIKTNLNIDYLGS